MYVDQETLQLKESIPAVDPLDSTSTMLQIDIVGDSHYGTLQINKETFQRYKELQDIIAILGLDGYLKKISLLLHVLEKLSVSYLTFIQNLHIDFSR